MTKQQVIALALATAAGFSTIVSAWNWFCATRLEKRSLDNEEKAVASDNASKRAIAGWNTTAALWAVAAAALGFAAMLSSNI